MYATELSRLLLNFSVLGFHAPETVDLAADASSEASSDTVAQQVQSDAPTDSEPSADATADDTTAGQPATAEVTTTADTMAAPSTPSADSGPHTVALTPDAVETPPSAASASVGAAGPIAPAGAIETSTGSPNTQNARDTRREGAVISGQKSTQPGDWAFDFHGYFNAPMRFGVGKRDTPAAGQSSTTLHSPLVPDDQYQSWQHTAHNPRSWAELYFGYGNDVAKGVVGIQAWNYSMSSWTNNQAQLGIALAFVELTPKLKRSRVHIDWKVGSFDDRYGMMGKYDPGAYETYMFGRTRTLGERLAIRIPVRDFSFNFEHGVGAARPDPSQWNTARFTLLHHAHAGVSYKELVELDFHYLTAWAQEEDRENEAENPNAPDGRMTVLGPDIRFDGGKFGYWYAGFSYIKAKSARTVGTAIEVVHGAGGGNYTLGIVDNYLEGPTARSNGNGEIFSLGLQTEHSLRKIMAGDAGFWGEGMDLSLSLYGMLNKIKSDDPDADGNVRMKYGADLVYSALPWLAVATRFDRVQPNKEIPEQSFGIFSPRIVFRSQWVTHEAITLQYSRYFYNQRICDPAGNSLQCVQSPVSAATPDGLGTELEDLAPETRGAPLALPDVNVFMLTANIWW